MVGRVSRWKERELWEGEDKSPAARERGREPCAGRWGRELGYCCFVSEEGTVGATRSRGIVVCVVKRDGGRDKER